jgi:hypothetical protein
MGELSEILKKIQNLVKGKERANKQPGEPNPEQQGSSGHGAQTVFGQTNDKRPGNQPVPGHPGRGQLGNQPVPGQLGNQPIPGHPGRGQLGNQPGRGQLGNQPVRGQPVRGGGQKQNQLEPTRQPNKNETEKRTFGGKRLKKGINNIGQFIKGIAEFPKEKAQSMLGMVPMPPEDKAKYNKMIQQRDKIEKMKKKAGDSHKTELMKLEKKLQEEQKKLNSSTIKKMQNANAQQAEMRNLASERNNLNRATRIANSNLDAIKNGPMIPNNQASNSRDNNRRNNRNRNANNIRPNQFNAPNINSNGANRNANNNNTNRNNNTGMNANVNNNINRSNMNRNNTGVNVNNNINRNNNTGMNANLNSNINRSNVNRNNTGVNLNSNINRSNMNRISSKVPLSSGSSQN